ncbi:TPA: hypothetical protein QDA94_003827 [Burkholderia vietnamiensis]|nr:hypothetical protein [Burkholderia vietnamiensis]HDR9234505.1 hypothetical protein [Burkholderia vietnamiensis]
MRPSRRAAVAKIGAVVAGYVGAPFMVNADERPSSAADVGLKSVVAVEDYYEEKDRGDWLAAFQRASNAIHQRGGGVICLNLPKYILGKYTGSDVDENILGHHLDPTSISRIWILPSNVLVTSKGRSIIDMMGGESSPFGYQTSINILSGVFDGEKTAEVIGVSCNENQIFFKNAPDVLVGQTIRLARNGRSVSSTPSREDAPNQFLTVRSIDKNSITVDQRLRQIFEYAENLVIRFRNGQQDYPKNIRLENLHFTATEGAAYICHSATIDSGWQKVVLDRGVSASWGTSNGVTSDCVTVISDDIKKNTLTIESTSDVDWGSLVLEGNGSSNSLGGLLVGDTSINVHFKHIEVRDFQRAGISVLFGGDTEIDYLAAKNCATNTPSEDAYSAAVSIGFPATGAGPSSSILERLSSKYKIRNTGTTKVRIRKLSITGQTTVPVRVHDAELTIDDGYIEFLDRGAHSPFLIGQSGLSRSDAKFFPLGGVAGLRLGKIRIVSLGKRTLSLVAKNAVGSHFSDDSSVKPKLGRITIDGQIINSMWPLIIR